MATSVWTELISVSFHWVASTGVSMSRIPRENVTCVRSYFSSNGQYVLVALLRWFVWWEVSGCTAAVFRVKLPGFILNSMPQHCVVNILLFLRVFHLSPSGAAIQYYWYGHNLKEFSSYYTRKIIYQLLTYSEQFMSSLCLIVPYLTKSLFLMWTVALLSSFFLGGLFLVFGFLGFF